MSKVESPVLQNKTGRKFVVIDQSLKGYTGHHYEYSIATARAARELGFLSEIFANRDFVQNKAPASRHEMLESDLICPWFVRDWMTKDSNHLKKYLIQEFASWIGFARQAVFFQNSFGNDLARLITEKTFQPGDHFFIHTVGVQQIVELLSVLRTSDRAVELNWHLVLRFEPAEKGTSSIKPLILKWLLTRLANLKRKKIKIKFYSDTEELANAYQNLTQIQFLVLPVLFDQTWFQQSQNIEVGHKTEVEKQALKVVYLGDARREKGFQHLPMIIRQTLARCAASKGKICFQIQFFMNSQSINDREMQTASRELQEIEGNEVQLVHGSLSPDEYNNLLVGSDIVLIPYESEPYRYRSSGILSQAILTGKPVIVPDGTWMSRQVAILGQGQIFQNFTEIPDLLMKTALEWQELQLKASEASKIWQREHSAQKLMSVILKDSLI